MDIFSYDLPPERIAQRPVYPYDQAKLLVINRQEKTLQEDIFLNITKYLQPSDVLIFNNSRVLPARLFGKLVPHGAEVEVLLVEKITQQSDFSEVWRALAKPLKKLLPDKQLIFSEDLVGHVLQRTDDKFVEIEFRSSNLSLNEALERAGSMPIPPYIRKGHSDEKDRVDYQSNFAKITGSIAAPTASLHFTPRLIDALKAQQLTIDEITLHVGVASFLPVFQSQAAEQEQKIVPPAAESFCITKKFIDNLNNWRAENKRLIAVGTTVTRALESLARLEGVRPDTFIDTDIFIKPGDSFANVDALVTNFHQPGTTHMLLVEALLGRDLIREAYQYALQNDFRFLSYGDGMLII